MMNNHSRSIEVEVELLWLGEMERWQEVMAHPTVIDGGARGVKGLEGQGLEEKVKGAWLVEKCDGFWALQGD